MTDDEFDEIRTQYVRYYKTWEEVPEHCKRLLKSEPLEYMRRRSSGIRFPSDEVFEPEGRLRRFIPEKRNITHNQFNLERAIYAEPYPIGGALSMFGGGYGFKRLPENERPPHPGRIDVTFPRSTYKRRKPFAAMLHLSQPETLIIDEATRDFIHRHEPIDDDHLHEVTVYSEDEPTETVYLYDPPVRKFIDFEKSQRSIVEQGLDDRPATSWVEAVSHAGHSVYLDGAKITLARPMLGPEIIVDVEFYEALKAFGAIKVY